MERYHLFENKEMTLLDLLDGIIDTGVVVQGEILISIANIDLIVVDLKLLISSIESAFGPRERNNGGEVIMNGTDALRLEQGRARIGEISAHDH
ncbi:gas vesicle protein [Neobacillus drentensis]|uniref:gas vesicle protein n=1 Tax=Neobacillus drentensis TaxID=220684 RepID=UPI0030032444